MNYSSTDYLKLLAKEHAHILLERSAPRGPLKRDFISLKLPSGEDIELRTPGGFVVCPVEMPHEILSDFLDASLVAQDHAEDFQDRAVFRLTEDGYKRARDTLAA